MLPVTLPVFLEGAVFGILALKTGLNSAEAFGMSALVTAGSAQYVSLSLWSNPPHAGTIIFATLMINLRYVLMGAALRPWLDRKDSDARTYAALFFVGDENWALSLNEWTNGKADVLFLFGSGVALFIAWSGGTLAGSLAGEGWIDLRKSGLDFAFIAVFTALLAGTWSTARFVFASALSAAIALLVSRWIPGNWYILAGGLSGLAFGAKDE